MKAAHWFGLLALVVPLAQVGCQSNATVATTGTTQGGTADQVHDIKGTVLAVAPDKRWVTLDREAVPTFLKATELTCRVEDPRILEGIRPGDKIEGRLEVKGRKPLPTVMTLVLLKKQP